MPDAQIDYWAERANLVSSTIKQWGVQPGTRGELYSFSDDPDLKPYCTAVALPQDRLFKPHGVWYSDGQQDNWLNWCCGEDCQHFLRRYLYRLELDRTSMLVLKTEQDLKDFTQQYGTHELGWEFVREINWPQVQQRFTGIEIMPYQWNSRLEPATSWYYSWDCASGCVWQPEAVLACWRVGENTQVEPRGQQRSFDDGRQDVTPVTKEQP